MPEIHPEDKQAYYANPDAFLVQLYLRIKGEYASLYPDAQADLEQASERLREGVHAGYSQREMLEKVRYLRDNTVQRFRSACARIVIDRFWLKKFTSPLDLRPVQPPAPYEGPMPEHP